MPRFLRMPRPERSQRHDASAPAEPASSERRAAKSTHRSYHRWRRLSRLATVAFGFLALVLLAWLLPWLPSGLEADDYTAELAFTVYLLGGVGLVGLAMLAFQEFARRNRDRLIVWSTVYDEATGLHNRTYLYDRLELECERARRSEGVFSLIVLQLRALPDPKNRASRLANRAFEELTGAIEPLIHPSDLVAMLSDHELAILAVRMDRPSRLELQRQVRDAVIRELPRFLQGSARVEVRAGSATYGADGDDAEALVHAARTSAVFTLPARGRQAA